MRLTTPSASNSRSCKVIIEVSPSRAIRQLEVGAVRAMIGRNQDCFGLHPERLAADSAYGSAAMLGRLVHERGIEPHIPVFEKSERHDGTSERADFPYDGERDLYTVQAARSSGNVGATSSSRAMAWTERQTDNVIDLAQARRAWAATRR